MHALMMNFARLRKSRQCPNYLVPGSCAPGCTEKQMSQTCFLGNSRRGNTAHSQKKATCHFSILSTLATCCATRSIFTAQRAMLFDRARRVGYLANIMLCCPNSQLMYHHSCAPCSTPTSDLTNHGSLVPCLSHIPQVLVRMGSAIAPSYTCIVASWKGND
jgi:hypothetical protein